MARQVGLQGPVLRLGTDRFGGSGDFLGDCAASA
jgi:hypothetical protein